MCSVTQLCLTLRTVWTIARQAPLSMGFPRQEYWGGFLCPPPGALSDPGVESTCPVSPTLHADCLPIEPSGNLLCSNK